MSNNANVVICGAGIAGVSAAYALAVQHGVQGIVLVDERPPLSLTSDKSSECYRNWWPGPDEAMIAFMNRSIDLLEELAIETGNAFQLNRRGYLYLSTDASQVERWQADGELAAHQGAGPLRIHRAGQPGSTYQPSPAAGFSTQLDGADLILDPNLLRQHYPFLSEKIQAGLHVRRAGWLSAQQLGALLIKRAREHGVRIIPSRVQAVEVREGQVQSVQLANGEQITCRSFVNAAGPMLRQVGQMLGVDLPVECELHQKAGFKDSLKVVPRDAPLLILTDPQRLDWTEDERALIAEDEENHYLIETLPSGAHTRPDGGLDSPIILLLWEYQQQKGPPIFPLPLDPFYQEIALRGLSRLIPSLKTYLEKPTHPVIDGGYYVKTPENRPLIGPLPVKGSYIYGALSGFGLMAACAGGELIANWIVGESLPDYATAFSLARYQDPVYQQKLKNWGPDLQL